MATLFIDDQSPDIQYLCPTINQQVLGSYYNNTWSTVNSTDCQNGWFQYTFYGTGIRVAAAVAYPGQAYSVKLDDGQLTPQSGNGSYVSPVLKDGKHTITYAIAPGNATSFPAFDYLTVTAGPSTPLKDQTVVVDDADHSLVFSGNWKTTPPVTLPFDSSTSLYHDTAHWSSSIGDSLQLHFSGSSISVFGILANVSSHGDLSASYSVDGKVTTKTIGHEATELWPMIQLFQADLPSGDHTLMVNLTSISAPQSLGIDFITYNSSQANAVSTTGASSTPSWAPKVGVAIGVVAGVVFVLGGLFVFWRHKRLQRGGKHLRLDG